MQIIIQISDTPASTTISETPNPLSTVVSLNNVNDGGGAPNITAANIDNSNGSVADQINIGGPPDWLMEALNKNKNSADNTASDTNASADGGGAPSF